MWTLKMSSVACNSMSKHISDVSAKWSNLMKIDRTMWLHAQQNNKCVCVCRCECFAQKKIDIKKWQKTSIRTTPSQATAKYKHFRYCIGLLFDSYFGEENVYVHAYQIKSWHHHQFTQSLAHTLHESKVKYEEYRPNGMYEIEINTN